MPQIIKLKHSLLSETPATLARAEPAYSEASETFFIGTDSGNVVPIGGQKFVKKLDLIEAGATADQTGAEIRSLLAGVLDTNIFTDAQQAKLAGLESSRFKGVFVSLVELEASVLTPVAGDYADVDLGVGAEVVRHIYDATDAVWAAQAGSSNAETSASVKEKYEANANTNTFDDAATAKLEAIEAGATADQTGVEMRALLVGVANTNILTDALQAKLNGIEVAATADQTGAEIVALAAAEANVNFVTDANVAKLNGIEVAATADQTGDEIAALLGAVDDVNLLTDADQVKLNTLTSLAFTDTVDGGSF